MGLDNRGSEEQRIIYRFLCQLYPTCDVIYEAQLPNGTRYDCFVKQMGIVVELDGVDAPYWINSVNSKGSVIESMRILSEALERIISKGNVQRLTGERIQLDKPDTNIQQPLLAEDIVRPWWKHQEIDDKEHL